MKTFFISQFNPTNIPEFLPEAGSPNALLYGLLCLLCLGVLLALFQYTDKGSKVIGDKTTVKTYPPQYFLFFESGFVGF